ncbi:asparaginase [Paenibacillus sp. J22TS3]|uniref:asparaginase n=1 Tax=Paenibacillus sp. J22TS3 TaxID=2807192 RepID=UPI001B212719|nr:asparaginase [Paenibacillus sp. J22TS3]GIP23431.1 asparaginase [Paenibacillus sp. J22TS3]
MSEVLVTVSRGANLESVHRGSIAVVDLQGNLLFSVGDPGRSLYARSAFKPIQAVPLVESGAADHYGFNEHELAVCCGSHNGEPMHTRTVHSILDKLGFTEEALTCGVHPPYMKSTYEELLRSGGHPSPIHNNCSGNHAGLLALAKYMGSDPHLYRNPDHPVQLRVREMLRELAGVQEDEISSAVDGCGIPTLMLPLNRLAAAYAQLGDPSALAPERASAIKRVTGAMVAHPEMVSGTGEYDSDVTRVLGGKVIAKVGAEGVHCTALLNQGIGIALKIDDGNSRAAYPAALEVLRQLGVLASGEQQLLDAHLTPVVRNHLGETVGRIEPVFTLHKA